MKSSYSNCEINPSRENALYFKYDFAMLTALEFPVITVVAAVVACVAAVVALVVGVVVVAFVVGDAVVALVVGAAVVDLVVGAATDTCVNATVVSIFVSVLCSDAEVISTVAASDSFGLLSDTFLSAEQLDKGSITDSDRMTRKHHFFIRDFSPS